MSTSAIEENEITHAYVSTQLRVELKLNTQSIAK